MTESKSQNFSLHQWIIDSRDGDADALNSLAEYLLPKAFGFASRNVQSLSPMDDYEDIAISAVKSVCVRIREGQSEFLGERELGGLLRKFVIGKIRDRRKYHLAEKRDINKNLDDNPQTNDQSSEAGQQILHQAVDAAASVWLDEQSVNLPAAEQDYLEQMLMGLGSDVQGLFAELVKRLDARPRKVLMLMTESSMSNEELAEAMDCAPRSIERHRSAIRKKLEEIVNE